MENYQEMARIGHAKFRDKPAVILPEKRDGQTESAVYQVDLE